MEHIPVEEWDVCMAQIARVLRPGGRLVITLDMTTPEADNRHYQLLCNRQDLRLLNEPEYEVPISSEDKQRRHPGYTYEVVGLVLVKEK